MTVLSWFSGARVAVRRKPGFFLLTVEKERKWMEIRDSGDIQTMLVGTRLSQARRFRHWMICSVGVPTM
jgi:hypothetical protein